MLSVQGNVSMIAGAGGNIAVQTGTDGVIVVDSGSGTQSDAVLAAIKRLSDQPIRYVINTSADDDHVGGNQVIAAAGRPLASLAGNAGPQLGGPQGAVVAASEPVLLRMSTPISPATATKYPVTAWPSETFPIRKNLYLNGEGIQVLHQPAAHSDGDAIVFFRKSDVIAVGEIMNTSRFPVIDVPHGGSINGEIDALNGLVNLVLPQSPLAWRDGGTQVIPGHGRIADQSDVIEYRDMVTVVRDRVKAQIKDKKTLEQVLASLPALGYQHRYGATSGPWTTKMFIEAVYASLSQEKR